MVSGPGGTPPDRGPVPLRMLGCLAPPTALYFRADNSPGSPGEGTRPLALPASAVPGRRVTNVGDLTDSMLSRLMHTFFHVIPVTPAAPGEAAHIPHSPDYVGLCRCRLGAWRRYRLQPAGQQKESPGSPNSTCAKTQGATLCAGVVRAPSVIPG